MRVAVVPAADGAMPAFEGGGPAVVLDPASGRLFPGFVGTPSDLVFVGGLHPLRAPHEWIAAVAGLARRHPAAHFLFPALPTGPRGAETLHLGLSALAPDRVERGDIGLPRAAEDPRRVADRRRLAYLRLLDEGSEWDLPLRATTVLGVRLGGGAPVPETLRTDAGLAPGDWAEIADGHLLIVSPTPPEGRALRRSGAVLRARSTTVVRPAAYAGLIAAIEAEGTHIPALVVRFDPAEGSLTLRTTALPGVRVRALRIGRLPVSPEGTEGTEVAAWTR